MHSVVYVCGIDYGVCSGIRVMAKCCVVVNGLFGFFYVVFKDVKSVVPSCGVEPRSVF